MNRELWNEFAATLNVFLVRKLNAGNAEPQAVLVPLAGALTGFLCTLAAAVAVLFFGRLAAAILAAIVLPLLLELLTDWHGLKNLSSYLTLRFRNTQIADAFSRKPEFRKEMTPVFLFVSLYLLRALSFGFITFRSPLVFVFVFTGAYLVRTGLAVCADSASYPLLELPEEKRRVPDLTALTVFALAGIFSFHLRLLAAAAVLFLLSLLIRRIQTDTILRHAGRTPLRLFEIYGCAAETLLLLVGIIVA